MKLKSKIEDAKKVNENLKEEKERKINNFNNIINEIKSFHRKINNYLLKQKNQHLSIKESMNNENNIEIYKNLISNFIKNKENLNRITKLKSNIKEKEEKEEKEKLKNKVKKIKEEIDLINEKIKKKKLEYNNLGDIKYYSKRYIINPIPIALEKNSEHSIQIELSEKFKENAIEVNQQNKIIKKEVENAEKELQKLKKKYPELENEEHKKDISQLNIQNNLSLKLNNSDDDSIGIVDDISNNIDSPKFLTKVIQNSKIDFQLEEKLDFSLIGKNKNSTLIKNKKLNKSSNNINNHNKNIFSLLNKNLNIKDNKNNNNNEELDFQIKNTEKQIKDLKELLTKLLEEKEILKNRKGNLQIEIIKQNSKIAFYKNQIQSLNNNNIKIIPNIISDKGDKDTSWRSIHDSGIFDVSL